MGFTTQRTGCHDVAPPVKLLWSAYARVYDGLLHFYPYRKLLDAVTERLRLSDGLRLLDVGCGTGNVMVTAASKAAVTMHGIDVAPAMVDRARGKLARRPQRGNAEVTCGEAITTMRSMPDGCFDRICLMNILYAVPDRDALWRECMRLLAPEGHIVATTSTKTGTLPLIREHLQNAPYWRLASPRLVAVCVFDGLICMLANARRFSFPSEDVLYAEVIEAGGVPGDAQRTYGGDTDGVNVLFTVRHEGRDLRRHPAAATSLSSESSPNADWLFEGEPMRIVSSSPTQSRAPSQSGVSHHVQ